MYVRVCIMNGEPGLLNSETSAITMRPLHLHNMPGAQPLMKPMNKTHLRGAISLGDKKGPVLKF